jgi:hypothetical protein
VLLCGAWWWVGRRGADTGQRVLPQGDLKEVENPMA